MDGQGSTPVKEWWDALSEENNERAIAFLNKVTRLDRLVWPHFKPLKGLNPLWEARWPGHGKVPHRVFLYPEVEDGSFEYCVVVFLCGSEKKGKKYKPRGAIEISVERHKEIERGDACACEFCY